MLFYNFVHQQFTIKEISNNRIIISGDTNVILIIDIIIYQIITKINCDYDWQYQTFIFTDDLGIIADKLLNLNTTFIIRRDDSCFYGYNKKMIKLSNIAIHFIRYKFGNIKVLLFNYVLHFIKVLSRKEYSNTCLFNYILFLYMIILIYYYNVSFT